MLKRLHSRHMESVPHLHIPAPVFRPNQLNPCTHASLITCTLLEWLCACMSAHRSNAVRHAGSTRRPASRFNACPAQTSTHPDLCHDAVLGDQGGITDAEG